MHAVQVVIVPIIKGSGTMHYSTLRGFPCLITYIHTYIHIYLPACLPIVPAEENEQVSRYVQAIAGSLRERKVRVKVDDRPNMR